jgi:hypothetical protein
VRAIIVTGMGIPGWAFDELFTGNLARVKGSRGIFLKSPLPCGAHLALSLEQGFGVVAEKPIHRA